MISKEDIKKLADLARIDIKDEEAENLGKEMDDILEYVCIHELAHLIEHNHSDRFWALVEKAMPNFREKINWLKENGHGCSF